MRIYIAPIYSIPSNDAVKWRDAEIQNSENISDFLDIIVSSWQVYFR